MLTLRRNAYRPDDQAGSVMIVVIVMLVVGLLVAAVLVQVEGSLNLARTDQNRTNAFHHANAGVDQALYRIQTGDFAGAQVSANGFSETVTSGTSQFEVAATKQSERAWEVRSTGTDPSGRRRQAVATVGARSLFANGFFTLQNFNLTGTQGTPVAYRSSLCPAADCSEPTPVDGYLGTNSAITGSSATAAEFVARWGGFKMYGRSNQADADANCFEGGCGTAPKVQAITNRLEVAVPEVPGTAKPCDYGGNIGRPGQTTTIAPGDYTCQDLNLQGTINISDPTGTVRFWATRSLTVGDGAFVNRYQRTPRFQIYFPEQSGPTSSSICDAEIWALLLTPGLTVDCRGGHQPNIYGAVVARLHDGRGSHFEFHWDMDALDAVHDDTYVVRNWRECPPDAATC
ncbi:MAG: hypothetical protein M3378_09370 [Actinomycetota bacterium]|nr:hypothetical protein [Actinomycetota bacterium]